MEDLKEIRDMMERASSQEPLPESLAPEAIEKMLREQEPEFRLAEKKRKRRRYGFRSLAAACLVLVISLSAVLAHQAGLGSKSREMKGVKDEEAGITAQGEREISYEALPEEVLPRAATNEEIYEKIKAVQATTGYRDYFYAVEEEKVDMAAPASGESESVYNTDIKADSVENMAEDVSTDYAKTNLQEQGVDEADEVKTDGKYFYIRREGENRIAVVKVNQGEMETVSEIAFPEPEADAKVEYHLHEFYLAGDRLYLMATVHDYRDGNHVKEETRIAVFDVTDRTGPKEITTLKQDGAYESSRMSGGYLYTFSDHYIYSEPKVEEPGTYIPCVNGESLPCEDIYIPENVDKCHYKVITSVNCKEPVGFQENKAVLCGSGWCYVSQNAIYFVAGAYREVDEGGYDMSKIWKFSYLDGKIIGSAEGTVKGTIRDQFALSEGNGYLRVVTTAEKQVTIKKSAGFAKELTQDVMDQELETSDVLVSSGETVNGLYVLDGNLQLAGSLENLAPGERIYSARFFDNTAYFVTFRETDPLFSVDLSDPTNPTLLGELKIPGFSEYLHPYGDGLLLGIGYDADEDGRQTGIKLTMFDVSDPANVKEAATEVIVSFGANEDIYYRSPAMDNHKAVLVDVEKNLIGFNIKGSKYSRDLEKETTEYVVYGYEPGQGFFQRKRTEYSAEWRSDRVRNYEEDEGFRTMQKRLSDIRGLFIGKCFYTINEGYEIQCFDMERDFQQISEYVY